MAGPMFMGDPFSNTGTVTLADGSVFNTTVEQFTGGRFTIANGQLVDTANPFNRLTLGQQGDVTLEALSAGRLNVVSETLAGPVNRPAAGALLRTVGGTVDVNIGTATTYQFTVNPIPVNGVNRQWIAYPREDGTTGFTAAKGPFHSTADVQAALGVSYRLATTEEAVRASVMRELLTNNRALLDQFIQDNGIDGSQTGNVYSDALNMILDIGSFDDLHYYSSYLIGGPND